VSSRSAFWSPLIYFSDNWISLCGVVLVTTAGLAWMFLLPVLLSAAHANPYLGLLTYIALPAAFFGGLALIPLGIWWRRRSDPLGRRQSVQFPPLDWHHPELRKLATFVAITTGLNLLIGTQLTYRAVEHMHSVSFCGQTCHTPMTPEFTAYLSGSHNHVECATCHVGPGAQAFVESKWNGAGQLISLIQNSYSRPIATPVRHLRPAREICLGCHSGRPAGGAKLRVIRDFSEDEANSPASTVLMLNLGDAKRGTGIHGAHLAEGVTIRYGSDEKRTTIAWVERRSQSGIQRFTSDATLQGPVVEREMDCLDCHNRPAHTFEVPARAVNQALDRGDLPSDLPFVKREALRLMQAAYPTREQGMVAIRAKLAGFYTQTYPQLARLRNNQIERSGQVIADIYGRNVFPDMKVSWGTYPNHIGHTDSLGCFRCHDDGHKDAQGKAIAQDCGVCHQVLAVQEPQPKVLAELGLQR
jgi:hypothetical protein